MTFMLDASAEGGPAVSKFQPAAYRVQADRFTCAVPHVNVVLRVAQGPGYHSHPHHFCRVGLRAVGNDDRPARQQIAENSSCQAVQRILMQRLAFAPYLNLYAGLLGRGVVFSVIQSPHRRFPARAPVRTALTAVLLRTAIGNSRTRLIGQRKGFASPARNTRVSARLVSSGFST